MPRHSVLTEVAAAKFYVMSSGMRVLVEDIRKMRSQVNIPTGSDGDKLVTAIINEIGTVLEAAGSIRPGDTATEEQLATVLPPQTGAEPEDDIFK